MTACSELAPMVGASAACAAMGVPRATYYRRRRPKAEAPKKPRPSPPRALGAAERREVLDTLHSPRFIDRAPAEVYATLLDGGKYMCSIRTMHRILAAENESGDRRRQVRHTAYSAPELLATGPNQVWSWDITKLKGPGKWQHYCLYVIMDIYSRYAVGWMVADREGAALASRLIYETCRKQGIEPGHLTIHADRGASMKSKPVALLMADLGVTKTHSRPHVSDDNPYSESQFRTNSAMPATPKSGTGEETARQTGRGGLAYPSAAKDTKRTLKYCPGFPERFGSLQDAREFCRGFFAWYNDGHRHWGIGLMTPDAVHHGRAAEITKSRGETLSMAFSLHPERFVKGAPRPPAVPDAAWINKPKPAQDIRQGA